VKDRWRDFVERSRGKSRKAQKELSKKRLE